MIQLLAQIRIPPGQKPAKDDVEPFSIETQERTQKTFITIDNAITTKDRISAHLGALQNRLENTVSNLSIQAENLQTSESCISNADITMKITEFVRSQVPTQIAVAMLGRQSNCYPYMLMQLLNQHFYEQTQILRMKQSVSLPIWLTPGTCGS